MSNVTSILASDIISASRSVINTNFQNLNVDKVETSVLTGSYSTSSTISGTFALLGWTNGTTTYNMATASGTQTIAHGLGRTPKLVEIFGYWVTTSGNPVIAISMGSFTASGNHAIQNYQTDAVNSSDTQAIAFQDNGGNSQYGVITVGGTNITITWTKTSSPTGTAVLVWKTN